MIIAVRIILIFRILLIKLRGKKSTSCSLFEIDEHNFVSFFQDSCSEKRNFPMEGGFSQTSCHESSSPCRSIFKATNYKRGLVADQLGTKTLHVSE